MLGPLGEGLREAEVCGVAVFVLDAEEGGVVAGIAEDVGEMPLALVEGPVPGRVGEADEAVALRVPAGEHGAPRRAADGAGRIVVGEQETVGGQGVDVRGVHGFDAVAPEVPARVVAGDDDDVGTCAHLSSFPIRFIRWRSNGG